MIGTSDGETYESEFHFLSDQIDKSTQDTPNQPNLLQQAQEQYPVLNKYDIGFKDSPGRSGGYMESWSPTETGSPELPRPSEFPLGKFGVENYRPDSRPIDLLGDVVSHHLVNVDPEIKKTYQDFQGSLEPWQHDILNGQYKHAQENYGEKRSYEDWKSNSGVPAYFRGYPFQQWGPDEEVKKFYTPGQIDQLDNMMNYLKKK